MQIDTAGTYTLKYTAEDNCGNVTEVTREVVAEQISYRTVLYTDGTFIINEKDSDQAANEALHGVATNVYDPMLADGSNYVFLSTSERPWHGQKNSIKYVKFGSSTKPISMAYWFDSCFYLETIDFANLNTADTISMRRMFSSCNRMTAIDVSSLNVSKVTRLDETFIGCSQLTELDLSMWDTRSVVTFSNMLEDCSALATVNVSGLVTSSATNLNYVFAGCTSLQSIDVSSWDTSSVTIMNGMFKNAGVVSVDISAWNTSSVQDFTEMFYRCTSLQNLNLGSIDTSSGTSFQGMFAYLRMVALDISSFNTAVANKMGQMFYECRSLETIYASSAFVTDSVTSSTNMFKYCFALVGGSGTSTLNNPTDKTYARIDNPPDAPGYFTARA